VTEAKEVLYTVIAYAKMWPREIFDTDLDLVRSLPILGRAGVYVLYRDDLPYYVGQATKLRKRLYAHAVMPGTRYFNFWNFFSVFVAEDKTQRNQIEAILIAAMPTANSAKPRLEKENLPVKVCELVRQIRRRRANPPK
jgi:predicted GIY-YIG superfamily endonuclease